MASLDPGVMLRQLFARLPSSLADQQTRMALDRLTFQVPRLIFRSFGFESLLGSEMASLDLAFCIDKKNAGTFDAAALKPHLGLLPWWQGILRAAGKWRESCSFGSALENLWIEYDTGKGPDPHPKLFAGIDKNLPWQAGLPFINELLHFMDKPEVAIDGVLGECLSLGASKKGKLFQVGLAPESRGIRLCFLFSDYSGLTAFMKDAGLPCYRNILDEISGGLVWGQWGLHLDFDPSLSGSVGVELYLPRDPFLLENQPLWEPVLDRLIRQGLCHPVKGQALQDWPGWSYEFFPGKEQFVTFRFLYYLKLLLAPARPPVVKGYFGFVNREWGSP